MTDQRDHNFENRLNDALKRNDLDLTGDQPIQGADVYKESGDSASGLAYGMRIGIEFMSGTVVGLAIGWGLDRYFDTTPWLLLLFTVLGFCAGLLNVFREVNNISASIGINRHNVLTKDGQPSKSLTTD